MNIEKAFELFGADKTITAEKLKKTYYRLALKNHPDKNNSEEACRRFQEINEAYELLKGVIEDEPEIVEYDDLMNVFLSSFSVFSETYHFIPKIISELSFMEEMPKEMCADIYSFISKNKDIFYVSEEFLEKMHQIILRKYKDDDFFLLRPTIDDLLDHNLYKLEIDGEHYIVPLWHNECYFDKKENGKKTTGEIIVRCIPLLNDCYIEDDNIYTEVTVPFTSALLGNTICVHLGKKVFEISCEKLQIKKNQLVILQKAGISKNQNITDDNKSDIFIKITFV
jgi:preprotein translocase subunit Sec63